MTDLRLDAVCLTFLAAVCTLVAGGAVGAATNLVLYPANPDHQTDGLVTGTLNGQAATFEYQHTYHPDSRGTKDFKANYVRFAADGPVDVNLSVNHAITTAQLRTVGKDLPFSRTGSSFSFTLPGPGCYYLQLPDLNIAGRVTYTVFFFFDDLSAYNAYQQSFSSARNVNNYGIVSSPTLNQTSAVQSVLNSGGSIYFPPGIYRTGQLNPVSNTTIYLAPGAVLKGTDDYNTSRYIYINGRQNVRIAGLGTVDANGFTSGNTSNGHLIDMESSTGVRLDDVVFRNSNSWMLHIRKCDQVTFDNVRLFSGKDGIDPDGSRDVLIQRATIQSIDDGFAVKSKFSGRSCERVTMRDCVVFSCASSLKIGTENYYGVVKDIVWDRCDAVDADRGCILYTKEDTGVAPISNITWRNIRVFNFRWDVETGGAPFQFDNNTGVSVSNVLLENIVAYPTTGSAAFGTVSATFRNVIVHGSSTISNPGLAFDGVVWQDVTSQSKPVVFIDPSPRNQSDYYGGDSVSVSVQHPYGKAITRVELFVDGASAGVRTAAPWSCSLSGVSLGDHTLQARATDADGATNTTAPLRVRVVAAPGPAVQITSGPTVSGITQAGATVTWTTSPPGNSLVDYGTTTSYGAAAVDSQIAASHSVALSGLAAGTTYHYRVRTQAAGCSDGVSGDFTFATVAAPPSVRNPGFEDGVSQIAWTRYGTFDSSGNTGIQSGFWFNIQPHSGSYFAGSAASYGKKNGGFYQRVTGARAGELWLLTAWVNTYNKGSSDPANTNNRIGIDPAGGTNPAAAGIVWSQRASTQYQWKQIGAAVRAIGGAMTLFLDAQQNFAVEWNLNAFDDCLLTSLSPISISEAVKTANGVLVAIDTGIVTSGTSETGGGFYIEDPGRCAGIRVASDVPVNRGDRLIVIGKVGVAPPGEKRIVADAVTAELTGQSIPEPLLLTNRDLGGAAPNASVPSVNQGVGLYNTGLLVRCYGRVIAAGADYFDIDDGSGIAVRIDTAGLSNPSDPYVAVTGISTVRLVNGKLARAVCPRNQADITGLAAPAFRPLAS